MDELTVYGFTWHYHGIDGAYGRLYQRKPGYRAFRSSHADQVNAFNDLLSFLMS